MADNLEKDIKSILKDARLSTKVKKVAKEIEPFIRRNKPIPNESKN